MLRVRYPNGTVLQYNDANHLYCDTTFPSWDLYSDSSKSRWIASIQLSSGAIVERVKPCAVYNENENSLENAVEKVIADAESVSGNVWVTSRLADLKHLLARFDGRTRMWKGTASR
jgi:hypothetical protein